MLGSDNDLNAFEIITATAEPPTTTLYDKGVGKNLIEDYTRDPTPLENLFSLISSHLVGFNLKSVINKLYESHNLGKIISAVFSVAIVQMTITSILYHQYLACAFTAYLAYVYAIEKDAGSKDFRNSKITLGAGALFFNYISPFIIDPATSPFLFMLDLYLCTSAWGALTSSLEKTKLLSKLTYYTGANAFVIESPLVYIGFLKLLENGYIDEIILKITPAPQLAVNSFLPSIKNTARLAVDDYLVTVSQVFIESFKITVLLPYEVIRNFQIDREVKKDFAELGKN